MLIFDYENAPKCVKMHIMEVSLEMCFWCFREIGTTVKHRRRGWITLTKHADHASPYSYSRNNSKSNIVTACNLCNQWKGSRVFESDDACRQYLERKWRNKIYEEMSVLPSGVYAEAELAGVLQPEMPERALAQEPVPRVPKVRNNGVIRDSRKEAFKISKKERAEYRRYRVMEICKRLKESVRLKGRALKYEIRKGRLFRFDLGNPELRRSDKLVDDQGNAFLVANYNPVYNGKDRRIGKNLYAQPIKPPFPQAKAEIRGNEMWWVW